MVRSSLVLSLAAAATSVLAVPETPAQDVVPGAYIIEIKEGQVRAARAAPGTRGD